MHIQLWQALLKIKKRLFKNFDYYSKITKQSEIFVIILNISDLLVFLL